MSANSAVTIRRSPAPPAASESPSAPRAPAGDAAFRAAVPSPAGDWPREDRGRGAGAAPSSVAESPASPPGSGAFAEGAFGRESARAPDRPTSTSRDPHWSQNRAAEPATAPHVRQRNGPLLTTSASGDRTAWGSLPRLDQLIERSGCWSAPAARTLIRAATPPATAVRARAAGPG